jgi:hypothetical protein
MKVFLKDDNDNMICKTKVYIKDSISIEFKSSIDILFYSKRLLELDKKLQRRFIEDIYELLEIKEWYFGYIIREKKVNNSDHIDKKLEVVEFELIEIYKRIAAKYGLTVKIDK